VCSKIESAGLAVEAIKNRDDAADHDLPFGLISRCMRLPIHDRAGGTVGRFRQQVVIAAGELCHIASPIVTHPRRRSDHCDRHVPPPTR
jgi:hypothetical protein